MPQNFKSIFWDFGDGNTSTAENPTHIYTDTGFYAVLLTVTDSLGCSNTYEFPAPVEIYPNFPPNNVEIRYVTVEDQNKVRVSFNPPNRRDIQYILVYRGINKGGMNITDTIYNISNSEYIDSFVNTTQNTYTYYLQKVNLCNQVANFDSSFWHTTILLKTIPDTNKVFLRWTRYKGWQPDSYFIERKNLNTGEFEILAVVDGRQNIDTFKFTDNQIICYQTHSYRIRALRGIQIEIFSFSNVSSATPVYIPNVQNSEIRYVSVNDSQFVDIQLEKQASKHKIVNYVVEKEVVDNIFEEIITLDSSGSLLWIDRDVETSFQPHSYRIYTIDSCGDTSKQSKVSTTILLNVDTFDAGLPLLNWTSYFGWIPQSYEVQLWVGNNWTTVSSTLSQTRRFLDEITDLNSLPRYCYRIKANSFDGRVSYSNIDCISPGMTLYVPNAFSPNGDDKNEKFGAVGVYVAEFKMSVSKTTIEISNLIAKVNFLQIIGIGILSCVNKTINIFAIRDIINSISYIHPSFINSSID